MYKHTSAERLDSEFTSLFAGLGIQDPAPGGNDCDKISGLSFSTAFFQYFFLAFLTLEKPAV